MQNENINVVLCPPCGEQPLAPEGFNPGVAVATKRGLLNQVTSCTIPLPAYGVLPPQGGQITARGFTLIELLVVVLIIGILAAVAVPQYQKAVLKSRYSTLMPVAKSVAQGNEVFYQGRGYYANNAEELDIQKPGSDEKTSVELATEQQSESGFDYVLASRTDLPGLAYIVYQDHSEQFPGAIMCEANDTLNPKASELCEKGLQGRAVSNGSLQGDNWKAYLLVGEQGSSKFTACTGAKPAPITAGQSGATGTATCNEETGEYIYEWTNGQIYKGAEETCTANSAYDCSGVTFKLYNGWGANCYGNVAYGCTGSKFDSTTCFANDEYGCANSTFLRTPSGYRSQCDSEKANGCASSTFEEGTYCFGRVANACSNTTFEEGGYCTGAADSACANATIKPGAYCVVSYGKKTCDGSKYPEEINSSGNVTKGCCKVGGTGGVCPSNSPRCGDDNKWDGTYWE